jgi:hypothetical protein
MCLSDESLCNDPSLLSTPDTPPCSSASPRCEMVDLAWLYDVAGMLGRRLAACSSMEGSDAAPCAANDRAAERMPVVERANDHILEGAPLTVVSVRDTMRLSVRGLRRRARTLAKTCNARGHGGGGGWVGGGSWQAA